jgi:4'-phosphopantetheinyl transferase EntD
VARRRPDAQQLATLIFSAKECGYKCQYPISRAVLDFSAMQIHLKLDHGLFHAIFLTRAGCFEPGDALPGRFAIGDRLSSLR